MAQFCCLSCGYEGHFVEFKVGEHVEFDEGIGEEIDVADVECPECGSTDAVET